MQRPVWIKVFGVLGLLMAVVSAIKNASELVFLANGPGLIDQMLAMFKPTATASEYEDLVEQWSSMRAALEQPVYRVVGGVESAGTLVMAGVLGYAAVMLLREREAGLRWMRRWAMYALVASVVTVVLDMRYAGGNQVPPGTQWLGALISLTMLWALPVCILTVLSRPEVPAYLRWRAQQPAPGQAMTGPMPVYREPHRSELPTPPQTQTPTRQTPPPPSEQDAWRDDPWNDPGSR